MALKLMPKSQYPRRQWSLVGYPGSGKSTFATQMRGPLLTIDADHRFQEVMELAAGDVYQLSGRAADNVQVARIAYVLQEEMADEAANIGTIVVDSLTAILSPLVMEAVAGNAAGANANKAAAFIGKAVALRWLQDAVTAWGTDVLWIYHLKDGRDNKAREVTTATVSKTELARLQRSLNARLRVVQEGPKRGIYVEWSRGRQGMTLWDESGYWREMPERLEEAMYKGLSAADLKKKVLPVRFGNPAEAITWAVQYGAFAAEAEAQAEYESVKAEKKPETAADMWDAWIVHVVAAVGAAGEGGQQSERN